MEIILTRKENELCYLYGSLYDGEEWICDTLEFGSGCQLQEGDYILSPICDKYTNQRTIGIFDCIGNMLSSFIKDNCCMYYNIKIRNENNKICVGFKVGSPLLTMYEHSMRLLVSKVTTARHYGERVNLIIQDIKNTTK